MKIQTREERYFPCPECGQHDFGVTHLTDGSSAGPWYCDECGAGWMLRIDGAEISVERASDRRVRTLVLLERGDLRLVVKGVRLEPDRDASPDELWARDRYFYEQHTCPINFLRDAVVVMMPEDVDPHGAFSYVGTVVAEGDLLRRLQEGFVNEHGLSPSEWARVFGDAGLPD